MRAKVSKKNILPAIMRTVSIADRKSVVPILSHVLMDFNAEGVIIKATDLDHSIIEKIPAKVDTYGVVAVPASTLCDILRKIPDSVTVDFSLLDKGDKLQVIAGRSKFEISTLNVEDFPQISVLENSCHFTLNVADFNKLLTRTKFSMSPEENRHSLNGIFLHKEDDKLIAASTDGHRLSVSSVPLKVKESIQGVIISKKTVQEIKKLLDVAEGKVILTFTANQVQFELGNVLFIAKLVDGNFPDYKRVIPPTDVLSFKVKRSDFVEVVDRVAVISDDKGRAVKLEAKGSSLSCSVANSRVGSGKDEVDIEYDGPGWVAGFNANYLLDVAHTLQGEQLKVYVNESLSPILVVDESEPESLYVVMPMRI